MDLFVDELIISRITSALFMPKDAGTPIHWNRPTHGFALNIDCAATYEFDSGETLTCHSGEIIYLPKGSNYTAERHMVQDTSARGVYAINFLTEFEQNENRPCVIRVKGKERLLSLFSRAANAWAKKEIGYYEECMSDLYQIIKLIKTEQAKYAPAGKSYMALMPALDYIGANFTSEAISVHHLAELCGVSEPYLRRLFQNAFSVSPAVYVRDLRLRYAKELLLTKEYSVTEVAGLAGFNDVAYFSREFKKATGVSPKDYE